MDPLVGLILILTFTLLGTTYIAAHDPYLRGKGPYMAQDTQLIGRLAPDAERNAERKVGWQGGPTDSFVDELTDGSDFSFWDRRADRQLRGLEISNMAGYSEPSMAAHQPGHYVPPVLPEGS